MIINKQPLCSLCGKESRFMFSTRYESIPDIAGQSIEMNTNSAGIYQCDNCNIRFTYPTVNPVLLTTLYEESDIDVWKESDDICFRRGFSERIEAIETFIKGTNGASILDVGCYTGAFLNCFSKDWKKFGIEPSKKASEVASEKAITVLGKNLPLETENNQFDVVTSLNVFEHILNPREFLQQMYDCLAKGGIIFIETGDYSTPFSKLMGSCWGYYHIPEHLMFYSKKGLIKLLEESGFEVLEFMSKLWHRKPLTMKQKVKHNLLTLRSFLQKLNIGIMHFFNKEKYSIKPVHFLTHKDHMYVIARKTKETD